jgi:hypothetical protein
MGRARVSASLEAGRFIRERGGALFVWLKAVGDGDHGWLKVTTKGPEDASIKFACYHVDGFDVFLDRSLPDAKKVDVELRRWPREHLVVKGYAGSWLGSGGVGGDGGGGDGGGC